MFESEESIVFVWIFRCDYYLETSLKISFSSFTLFYTSIERDENKNDMKKKNTKDKLYRCCCFFFLYCCRYFEWNESLVQLRVLSMKQFFNYSQPPVHLFYSASFLLHVHSVIKKNTHFIHAKRTRTRWIKKQQREFQQSIKIKGSIQTKHHQPYIHAYTVLYCTLSSFFFACA